MPSHVFSTSILIYGALLIFVKFDVEQFPFADANAGVAALMGLVAIVTAQILHRAARVDFHFINGKEAEPISLETFLRLLPKVSSCLSESVFAQLFPLFLLLLRRCFEVNNNSAACQQIVELAKTEDYGSALGPCGAISGARIPREGEKVAAGHHHAVVVDDALAVFLVEEQAIRSERWVVSVERMDLP